MIAIVFIGEGGEYLGYKSFEKGMSYNVFMTRIEDLMLANIEKKLPLRERLKLAPEYFPFAGRVQDIDIIELN